MLLSNQRAVLTISGSPVVIHSDVFYDDSECTIDTLTINFWSDFFKTAINHCRFCDIPVVVALANAVLDPTSKFSRAYHHTSYFGRSFLRLDYVQGDV